MNALARLTDRIEFVGLVDGDRIGAEPEALDAEQSAYWGHPVRVSLVPAGRRRETLWNHYGAGIFDYARQPPVHHFAGPEQVAAIGRHLATEPDLVFVFRLGAMAAVLRSGYRGARMFFDFDDIEHKIRVRSALQPPHWPGKLAYLAHVPAIIATERRAARASRATFVCSQEDAEYLRRLGYGPGVHVVPNAMPMPERGQPLASSPTLMFIGTYGYQPNLDAATRLVERIWPLVHAANPDSRLIVAGKECERIPAHRSPPPGVEFAGFVSDLEGLYARSRVVVCPIMVGGGTRLKLIEAGGYGKPIVSTRIGAEGLAFEDGKDVLLREDDESFAAACRQLLADDALCNRLGAAAREKMQSLYDARNIERRIAEIVSR